MDGLSRVTSRSDSTSSQPAAGLFSKGVDGGPKRVHFVQPIIRIRLPTGYAAKQEARIAIRIKPVALLDRMGIGLLHGVETCKGRDQHEKSRARQVKIRQEDIDRAETIARRDEYGGFVRKRPDRAVLGSRAFQQTQGRGADGNDAAAFSARLVKR